MDVKIKVFERTIADMEAMVCRLDSGAAPTNGIEVSLILFYISRALEEGGQYRISIFKMPTYSVSEFL